MMLVLRRTDEYFPWVSLSGVEHVGRALIANEKLIYSSGFMPITSELMTTSAQIVEGVELPGSSHVNVGYVSRNYDNAGSTS